MNCRVPRYCNLLETVNCLVQLANQLLGVICAAGHFPVHLFLLIDVQERRVCIQLLCKVSCHHHHSQHYPDYVHVCTVERLKDVEIKLHLEALRDKSSFVVYHLSVLAVLSSQIPICI